MPVYMSSYVNLYQSIYPGQREMVILCNIHIGTPIFIPGLNNKSPFSTNSKPKMSEHHHSHEDAYRSIIRQYSPYRPSTTYTVLLYQPW